MPARSRVKTFFHVDMDAFFVSVEELYDPSLKGKPVVVGGKPNERGVVSAASYAAREFGVHSAMPLRTAYQRCPQAIFVDGHPERYREYSGRVYEALRAFSPVVEMASIDEAYLDMTGTERLHGPPLRAAHRLHARVKEDTGLNCSIGISASRMVAKISSDQAKPNGVLWVIPGCEAAFLAPLEVRRVPGVGKVMEKNLHTLGIRKVGDLARLDEAFLTERFGKWGLALAGKSHGLDAGGWFDEEIGAETGPKSISHEHTFSEDTADLARIEATLSRLCEMVGRRLREHALSAGVVQLKLRYADFSTITRAHSIARGTRMDTELFDEIRELFRRNWKPGAAVRLLGVHVSNWTGEEAQMEFRGEERREKWSKTMAAADKLRIGSGTQRFRWPPVCAANSGSGRMTIRPDCRGRNNAGGPAEAATAQSASKLICPTPP